MPHIGEQFATLNELRDSVNAWAIREHVSYRAKYSDQQRYIPRCKAGSSCRFKITAYPRRSEYWEIVQFEPHSCPAITHDRFRVANAAKHIAKYHLPLVSALPTTTPKHLVVTERLEHGNQISYLQAWRAKHHIMKQVLGDEEHQFQKLEALLELLNGYYCFKKVKDMAQEIREQEQDYEDDIQDTGGDTIQQPDTFACYFLAP